MFVKNRLLRECIAEVIGTFLLVFFGTGAVFVAALTGALLGIFQVAIVWGLVISLAIYATSAISGTHINPAVTIALWAWRGFPRAKIIPYILSQVIGAFLASALLLALFSGVLTAFEHEKGLVRGHPGSELSAMVFGEYFPNPGICGTTPEAYTKVSQVQAMTAEGFGTAVLVFLIFALTDPRNRNRPDRTLFAPFIGLTITILICVLAPLTQAGFNPARDFGPRVLAYFAGWGAIAIPGPRGGFFTVFILSPIVGGLIGGGLYDLLLRPAFAVAPVTVAGPDGVPELLNAKRSHAMSKPRYVMIGGFLGAGKTTAMVKLAQHLAGQGIRVGLITNDQSVDLVDTARVRAAGFPVQEITGGCFCCKFNSLLDAAQCLTAQTAPAVLIAEPVGSCTDLKATVSYPLRQLYGSDYEVAPLSVLVDPIRCARILGLQGGKSFSEKVLYVYRKQLEEAEYIVINKIDLLDPVSRSQLADGLQKQFPQARVLEVSCQTGEGLTGWFEAILVGELGRHPSMNVDYDVYADGEALLGWLNTTARVAADEPFDGNEFLISLAQKLRRQLAGLGVEIAHLKMTLTPSEGPDLGAVSLTRTEAAPQATHTLKDPLSQGEVTINLRAEADPAVLKRVVGEALATLAPVTAIQDEINAFRPGRPNPTHRMATALA